MRTPTFITRLAIPIATGSQYADAMLGVAVTPIFLVHGSRYIAADVPRLLRQLDADASGGAL